MVRRGWLLLEAMVALALLVVLVAGVQSAIASAGNASRVATQRAACEDLARSVLGAIELGLATPETVHDRVVDWPSEAPWRDPDEWLGQPEEGEVGEGGFRIEVETEPMVRGAMLVLVTVRDPETRGAVVTLRQAMVDLEVGR